MICRVSFVLAMSKSFLKKTAIAYRQNLVLFLEFRWYAIAVFFKNASASRVVGRSRITIRGGGGLASFLGNDTDAPTALPVLVRSDKVAGSGKLRCNAIKQLDVINQPVGTYFVQ